MPLFYFNVFADEPLIDNDGIELDGLGDAFAHAADMACIFASRTVLQGHVTLSHYVEIANYTRERVGRLCFGDAVELRP
jgi:hypothetical protein